MAIPGTRLFEQSWLPLAKAESQKPGRDECMVSYPPEMAKHPMARTLFAPAAYVKKEVSDETTG